MARICKDICYAVSGSARLWSAGNKIFCIQKHLIKTWDSVSWLWAKRYEGAQSRFQEPTSRFVEADTVIRTWELVLDQHYPEFWACNQLCEYCSPRSSQSLKVMERTHPGHQFSGTTVLFSVRSGTTQDVQTLFSHVKQQCYLMPDADRALSQKNMHTTPWIGIPKKANYRIYHAEAVVFLDGMCE